ncbi:hypothetical protein B0T25DRAFT_624587 [Lasiosphaeria hispida]|uniref:Uncharacterized protein n=1 Tax=Lasiosphaeria hispida TaxID=260671 RepID=A0AAJ0MA57_9PEZI|nr:hypothetical protein B0T25DRAFT_624587 [Lasiosphaeria hispida]
MGTSPRMISSSVSATSSVYQFVEEFGRTYHAYKEGKYFMPNDIPEQERLASHPTATSKSMTPRTNGSTHPFDLVHSRFMCGAFSDFPRVFRSAFASLSPGGWAEFQDYYVKMQCVDGSLDGTALEQWNNLLLEGVAKLGKNGLAVARFRQQVVLGATDITRVVAAGFVDVVERKFALPGNAWAKGREEKIFGTMQMMNIMDGLHGIPIGLFTKVLGMSVGEVEALIEDTRRDLKDKNIHFYYVLGLFVVW